MSRDEIHNKKNLQRYQASDIIEFPNYDLGCYRVAFYYFPLPVNEKMVI